jgi:uncharacterized protein (TIGR00730 family)
MAKKSSIPCKSPFPTAKQDATLVAHNLNTAQSQSPSYRLAYDDFDFMMRDELRPVRLQLELLKPELTQIEENIQSTIVIFGSARISDKDTALKSLQQLEELLTADPNNSDLKFQRTIAQRLLAKSYYYDEARKLGSLISLGKENTQQTLTVVTGGGPGIMEAANRGAADVGSKNIGLNIVLPGEQKPNPYITPELCFQFHYFAIRKMHFLMRAIALIAFPGGFGTLDELFEALTLIQTKKVRAIPIILFGEAYWSKLINFDLLVEEGVITPCDRQLIQYAETAEQAWDLILESYSINGDNYDNI